MDEVEKGIDICKKVGIEESRKYIKSIINNDNKEYYENKNRNTSNNYNILNHQSVNVYLLKNRTHLII